MWMGRTGILAFEHFNIVPDILTLGKALRRMPIGAMVSSKNCLINLLTIQL